MDQMVDELMQIVADKGWNILSVVDAVIHMAARDHHEDLIHGRVARSLYSGRDSFRANGHVSLNGSINGFDLTREESNPLQIEASPEMRSDTPQDSPERSPEADFEEIQEEEQSVKDKETDSQISEILAIKEYLKNLDEFDEESLLSYLQSLASMDITYAELKETDIGIQVNSFRKHPSSEVRLLVKQTVRKWKDLVEAKMNNAAAGSSSPAILTDGESPPQQIPPKRQQEMMQSPRRNNYAGPSSVNGSDLLEPKPRHGPIKNGSSNESDHVERKVKPDLIRNGSASGSDRVERRVKPDPRSEAPARPTSRPSPPARDERKELKFDSARLDSARRRLQENYQEANNAKRQRTVQVMDINEIPKPKKAFIRKSGPTAKHR